MDIIIQVYQTVKYVKFNVLLVLFLLQIAYPVKELIDKIITLIHHARNQFFLFFRCSNRYYHVGVPDCSACEI